MSRSEWTEALDKIKTEITSLAKYIDKTRVGLDTIESTIKVGSEKFPEASSHISAVTGDLENAANKIMGILEGFMAVQDRTTAVLGELAAWSVEEGRDAEKGRALLAELDGINTKSRADTMEIFAHMSFQDLTGQKLKKVIGSLAVVEGKLLDIAQSFGIEDKGGQSNVPGAAAEVKVGQDVVDKLLKELGA